MTDLSVVARDVTKAYGQVHALKGITLEIRRGEIFALLGPNGAGKTTFIEILEGHRRRTSGDARVLGTDPGEGGHSWRAQIGVVLQSTAGFEVLTIEEVVTEFARFYPKPMAVDDAIATVGLTAQRRVRCGRLSGGQRRRVELALGIVGDPELIFLDEPTTGLDPEARRQLWEVVRHFAALGKTVVLTTHYLEEAEALADRVAIIIDGELAALGEPREIGDRDRELARMTFQHGEQRSPLPPLPGQVTLHDGWATVTTDRPTEAVLALQLWMAAEGLTELPGLTITRPSLEDVYLQLVRETAEGNL